MLYVVTVLKNIITSVFRGQYVKRINSCRMLTTLNGQGVVRAIVYDCENRARIEHGFVNS